MICTETRNRIRLSVAAYAYEMLDVSVMSDTEFDGLSKSLDPTFSTGNKVMDDFFSKEFKADTGMWIHKHPNLEGIKSLYKRYYKE
jgi:hypothetical protein